MLNVARLTGWKGQSVLIEAAALPPLAGRDDVVVILAGDEQGRDAYRAELEAQILQRASLRARQASSGIAPTCRRRCRWPTSR